MRTVIIIMMLLGVAGSFFAGAGWQKEQPPVVAYVQLPPVVKEVVKEVIVERKVPVAVITTVEYRDRVSYIHNEPGLHEFKTYREMKEYIAWYRTEKMVQYGQDQCEDYAYDFMRQAVADGYLVSTELVEIPEGWHMANTTPIGNQVYLVDISSGAIRLYGLKD